MTAAEIRGYVDSHVEKRTVDHSIATFRMLGEIAAQIAEYNERAARQEPFALKIAQKSLAMMERTEKACDELVGTTEKEVDKKLPRTRVR